MTRLPLMRRAAWLAAPLLSILASSASAQLGFATIATVAGNGTESAILEGDGGAATATAIGKPKGLAFDAADNLYFSAGHAIRKMTPAGVLSTFAGTGVAGYGGDGGAATSAQLDSPRGLAVDGAGNLYVADTNNHRVRKITPEGVISTHAGNGGTEPENVPTPRDIAFDTAGNLYIASADRILKMPPAGTPALLVGCTDARAVRMNDRGAWQTGKLYALCGEQVFEFNSAGNATHYAGTASVTQDTGNAVNATSAGLHQAQHLAIDADGLVYVGSRATVRQIAVNRVIHATAGTLTAGFSGDGGPSTLAQVKGVAALAFSPAGHLYVADADNVRVRKVTYAVPAAPAITALVAASGGVSVNITASFGPFGGRFVRNYTLACGSRSTTTAGPFATLSVGGLTLGQPVTCTVRGNSEVGAGTETEPRMVDVAAYLVHTVAGSLNVPGYTADGIPAVSARLASPQGLAIDVNGVMVIADTDNNCVRVVHPASGNIMRLAGQCVTGGSGGSGGDGGPAASALLTRPASVAVDAAANVFIAEPSMNRIRKITPEGIITLYAGVGTAGFSGDGGSATTAELNSPRGLSVDASGNLYVADTLNQRIRKITPAGVISTVAGNGARSFAGDGGNALSASLADPKSTAVGADGTLYIADTANNRVRKVAANGVISTIAGNGSTGPSILGLDALQAPLDTPTAVAIGPGGVLYVSMNGNYQYMTVQIASGTIQLAVGTITTAQGADGTFASQTGGSSDALAFDVAGNLYFLARNAHAVRKVTMQKPPAPIAVVATVDMTPNQVRVNFTLPAAHGGYPNTNWTVTCGTVSVVVTSSPAIVNLPNSSPVSCTVTGQNAMGTGPASLVSNTVAPGVPGAPVIGTATPGIGNAMVEFTPPANDGGSPITSYTATCGAMSITDVMSPIVVEPLPAGQAVTCTVRATNSRGTGPASAASNAVTPLAMRGITHFDVQGDNRSDVIWYHSGVFGVIGMNANGLALEPYYIVDIQSDANWQIVGLGDLNGDRRSDLVWYNTTTGELYGLLLNGASLIGEGRLALEANLNWKPEQIADLDGDGKADVVWKNQATGDVFVMLMNGLAQRGGQVVYGEPNLNWKIVASGDMNGDGKADLLWRNVATGDIFSMLMDGFTVLQGGVIYTEPNLNWKIVGLADYNADGKSDVLWQNVATGEVFQMQMNGTVSIGGAVIYTEPNTEWKIAALGDYNGDGKADILWQNTVTGQVYMILMDGFTPLSAAFVYTEPDTQWKIVGP
jgi:hypothetical protein